MKVIHELIAVEVPRGARKHYVVGDKLRYTVRPPHKMDYTTVQLPFPCTIIGLASGIKELQTDDFMKTTAIVFNAAGRDYQSWADLYNDFGMLPTPTTDIIFLRKKL